LDVVLAAALLADAAAAEKAPDGVEALLADVVAGKRLVTIARADSAFSGNHATATRYEGGRLHGPKHFVPFATHADALVVTTPDALVLAHAPFAVAPLE